MTNKEKETKNYALKTPQNIEEAVVGTYRNIEGSVVGTYKSIEGKVVGTYKEIEDSFVKKYLKEEAKEKDANYSSDTKG